MIHLKSFLRILARYAPTAIILGSLLGGPLLILLVEFR